MTPVKRNKSRNVDEGEVRLSRNKICMKGERGEKTWDIYYIQTFYFTLLTGI